MHAKMNVIFKIRCYIERSVVTLKLRKEYLDTVTHNTPIASAAGQCGALGIKY